MDLMALETNTTAFKVCCLISWPRSQMRACNWLLFQHFGQVSPTSHMHRARDWRWKGKEGRKRERRVIHAWQGPAMSSHSHPPLCQPAQTLGLLSNSDVRGPASSSGSLCFW